MTDPIFEQRLNSRNCRPQIATPVAAAIGGCSSWSSGNSSRVSVSFSSNSLAARSSWLRYLRKMPSALSNAAVVSSRTAQLISRAVSFC